MNIEFNFINAVFEWIVYACCDGGCVGAAHHDIPSGGAEGVLLS